MLVQTTLEGINSMPPQLILLDHKPSVHDDRIIYKMHRLLKYSVHDVVSQKPAAVALSS